MMAAWHCALDFLPDARPMPVRSLILICLFVNNGSYMYQTWYFARDDRVHKTLIQELDKNATTIKIKAGRRLRWQFRVLRAVMEGRSTSSKVNLYQTFCGPANTNALPAKS